MPKETPSEYLEKHKQFESDQKTQERINKLYDPWEKIEYEESDKIEVVKGNFTLSFSYQKVPFEISSKFTEKGLENETYFELSDFELKNTDKNIIKTTKEFLPKDFKVYFALTDIGETCYLLPDSKRIVLHGDPTSPRIFLALFHEIGHIYELQTHKDHEWEQITNRRIVDTKDLANKMRAERDAWAFALKYLWPIFDKKTEKEKTLLRNDVMAYAKNIALHSYSESIEAESKYRNAMQDFAKDYIDDYDLYGWEGYPEDDEN